MLGVLLGKWHAFDKIESFEPDHYSILMCFAHPVQINEALIDNVSAFNETLYVQIEVFHILLAIELIIVCRLIEVGRLMNHDLTHLIDKSALLGSQETEKRRYIYPCAMQKLLQVKFLINLGHRFL